MFGYKASGLFSDEQSEGAYISSEAAKDQNCLKTGTLSYSAIENHSDYQASTLGISGGATTGDGGNVYQPTGRVRARMPGERRRCI